MGLTTVFTVNMDQFNELTERKDFAKLIRQILLRGTKVPGLVHCGSFFNDQAALLVIDCQSSHYVAALMRHDFYDCTNVRMTLPALAKELRREIKIVDQATKPATVVEQLAEISIPSQRKLTHDFVGQVVKKACQVELENMALKAEIEALRAEVARLREALEAKAPGV